MAYQIDKESKKIIKAATQEFGKASVALVTATAGLIKAQRIEMINNLSIPAARRPKVGEVKEAIRAEFGGLEKEGNRQAYDLCSLAFRIYAKIDKEHDGIMSELASKNIPWLEGQVSVLAGRRTVDAWKAWVTGEKKAAVEKTPGERLAAYFEKNAPDLTDTDLTALSDMIVKEVERRATVAMAQAA